MLNPECKTNDTCPQACEILGGMVTLYQPSKGSLRAGLDAVMLAAACEAKSGDCVVDLGTGCGAAGLCVAARVDGAHVVGVELDAQLADFAKRGRTKDGRHIDVVNCDIRKFSAPSMEQRFDHAICNPPFLEAGTYIKSPHNKRAKACGIDDEDANLDDWVKAAVRALKPKGTFTIIHRADYLADILSCLNGRFGAAQIIPLYPKEGESAKRIIIKATKGSNTRPAISSGIVIHESDGKYTKKALSILKDAQSL